jgi:hypothetical protein
LVFQERFRPFEVHIMKEEQQATNLIKKLELKPGCKYLLFVPASTGLNLRTLADVNDDLHKQGYKTTIVLVQSTDGIMAVEEVPNES